MDRFAMDSLLVLTSIRTCYCKLSMSQHGAAAILIESESSFECHAASDTAVVCLGGQ
jgi:hypothetical protein